MDSYSGHPRRQSLSSTPKLTRLAAPTRVGPHSVMSCSWAPTSSSGSPSGSLSSPAPAQKVSTASWPKASWMRQLLHKLHSPLQHVTLVYCGNISMVYLSTNPVQHQRTKHVEIDMYFACIAVGDVRVLSVPTTLQFADIFTKRLSSCVFLDFRSSLNIYTRKSCDCGECYNLYYIKAPVSTVVPRQYFPKKTLHFI
jgi:hypothetical protein